MGVVTIVSSAFERSKIFNFVPLLLVEEDMI